MRSAKVALASEVLAGVLLAALWLLGGRVPARASAAPAPPGNARQRQMEKLGRGVVALRQGDGTVYVGWRLLGTDPNAVAFNVYRVTGNAKPVKRNDRPLADSTNFVDTGADPSRLNAYFVRPVVAGDREEASSAPFTLPANTPAGRPYLSVPLQTPSGYTPNDASVGDLDGDGEYEIVLHQAGRAHDNSHDGPTDPPLLQAYKLDGTRLWTINLGKTSAKAPTTPNSSSTTWTATTKRKWPAKPPTALRTGAARLLATPKRIGATLKAESWPARSF